MPASTSKTASITAWSSHRGRSHRGRWFRNNLACLLLVPRHSQNDHPSRPHLFLLQRSARWLIPRLSCFRFGWSCCAPPRRGGSLSVQCRPKHQRDQSAGVDGAVEPPLQNGRVIIRIGSRLKDVCCCGLELSECSGVWSIRPERTSVGLSWLRAEAADGDSSAPVCDLEPRNALELSGVVGYQGDAATQGVSPDQGIQRTDGRPLRLQMGPHSSVGPSRLFVE
jgi:hypothetical protein